MATRPRFDAAAGQIDPRIKVRGKFVVERDDIVPPCQGNPSATRLMPSVVLRIRAISSGSAPINRAPNGLHLIRPADPTPAIRYPPVGHLLGIAHQCIAGRRRQRGHRRVVEVGPAPGDGHLAAEFGPDVRRRQLLDHHPSYLENRPTVDLANSVTVTPLGHRRPP